MKTTQIENYIFECIDFENYGFNPETKKEKLKLLIETFKAEHWHDYNKNYYKHNTLNGFVGWSQGLPSCFNIDFENYRILEIGKSWGFNLDTEKKETLFLENWFKMIAKSIFYLNSKL